MNSKININQKIKKMNSNYKKEWNIFEKELKLIDSFYSKTAFKLIDKKEFGKALYIVNKSPDDIFKVTMINLITHKSGTLNLKQTNCSTSNLLIKFKKDKIKYSNVQKRWGVFLEKYRNFFIVLIKKNKKDIRLAIHLASQATEDDMVLKTCLRFLAQTHPNAEFYSLKQ